MSLNHEKRIEFMCKMSLQHINNCITTMNHWVFLPNLMSKDIGSLFGTKLPVLFPFIYWSETWDCDQSSDLRYFLVFSFCSLYLCDCWLQWLLRFWCYHTCCLNDSTEGLRKRSFRKRKSLFPIFTLSCDLLLELLKLSLCIQISWI